MVVSSDKSEIEQVLLTYEDGLNKASVEQCVGQYAKDGVCMPPNQNASTGTAALNKTYQGFFSMLKFNVKFNIVEAHAITSDWGFARTTSAGTTTLIKAGKDSHEANHELFVMKKEEGSWKIARYCFCTTNPPQ